MRKSVSRANGLLVLSTFLVAMTAAAAPIDRVSPTLRAAMQRDLGLTSVQLNNYFRVESIANAHHDKLAAAEGRNFGGSWIEKQADGNFKLVIATTGIGGRAAPAGVEYRHVRYALADLKASKGELDAMVEHGAKVPKLVYSWYVDPKSNNVVVGIGKGGRMPPTLATSATSGTVLSSNFRNQSLSARNWAMSVRPVRSTSAYS